MQCFVDQIKHLPQPDSNLSVVSEDNQLICYKIREKNTPNLVPKLVNEYSHLVSPDLVTT